MTAFQIYYVIGESIVNISAEIHMNPALLIIMHEFIFLKWILSLNHTNIRGSKFLTVQINALFYMSLDYHFQLLEWPLYYILWDLTN